MTVQLEQSLVAQLDPERDYGSRTYEQVIAEVQSGTLVIEQPVRPGARPILRDAATRVVVKGSGPPTVKGGPTRSAELHARLVDWAERVGLELAIGVLHEVLSSGSHRDALKAIEVLFKYVLPKPSEARYAEEVSERLMVALLASRPAVACDADFFGPSEPGWRDQAVGAAR